MRIRYYLKTESKEISIINFQPNEPSGMDVIVKEDDKKTKMDDGYEDFGPGAQQS